MNLSELIKRLARLFGYNLVRRPEHFMQDKSDGTQEGHLVALLAKLEVDLVLDVGANNGQYAKGIRRAGYAGPIISFEPAPEPFAKLRKASEKDPDWKAVQAALGSASGVGQLNLARASALNSFLAPNEYALTMKNWLKGKWETIETIDVPIRTLDEVLAEASASSHEGSSLVFRIKPRSFSGIFLPVTPQSPSGPPTSNLPVGFIKKLVSLLSQF